MENNPPKNSRLSIESTEGNLEKLSDVNSTISAMTSEIWVHTESKGEK